MHCNFSQLPRRKLERDGWYPCRQCGGGIPVGNLPQFCKQGSTSFAPGSMLIRTLWKNCVCCIPICGRRKNFGPNIENNWSAMLVLRKLSGTQKTQMRELVTERVPIIGFLHPFLVVKIKQSLKVADQDCDIDARGEGGGGDHCWGGKHRLQQNQGGQDDDDAQLIFLFPKIKIPFDWGTITDSCDYVLYRVPMCIVV